MNTKNYGGKKFNRSISVYTNDPVYANNPKKQKITLHISGQVEKVVQITPKKVRLTGFLENEISATVKIVPEKKFAFKVIRSKMDKGKNISYDLKEMDKSGKFEYLLKITNLSKVKGRYFDAVILETDSKIMPEIKIKIFGNIRSKVEEEKQKNVE